jgi:hypothetical protein
MILKDSIQRVHNRIHYDRSLDEAGREMLRNQIALMEKEVMEMGLPENTEPDE